MAASNQSITLKQSGLPDRPRHVVESLLGKANRILEAGIKDTFNEIEQQLFKLAEKARSNEEQNRCFESLREIRRGRADVIPRFMMKLEESLASIGKPGAGLSFQISGSEAENLTLLDKTEFEETLALREVASRAEIRYSPALYALGQRFGVLAGSKAFEAEHLPLGPYLLCEIFRHATLRLDLRVEYRVLLYRAFDRLCLNQLGDFFEALNKICVEQRILPNLALSLAKAKKPLPAQGGKNNDAQPNKADEAKTAPVPSAQQPQGFQRSAGMGGQPTYSGEFQKQFKSGYGMPAGANAPEMSDIPGLSGANNPLTGWPGQQRYTARQPMQEERVDTDQEVFETMRDLLASRRNALGLADKNPQPQDGHAIQTEDVQSVLASLQTKSLPRVHAGGRLVNRSVTHLKQDLFNQLHKLAPEGAQPMLNAVDNDTIDLVGMLFDNLVREVKATNPVNDLVTQMQVPLLRVALRDKSFFVNRAHPARQLLNTIIETGAYWIDDENDDKQLVEKMRLAVEHVANEYDDDIGVFQNLNDDLNKHLSLLAHKSEVAERRHIDAAKGKERLELARHTANAAIKKLIQEKKPSTLIKTLLEKAWADVLTLTILRQGEDNAVYKKRLSVAGQIVDIAEDPKALQGEARDALRKDVEAGLIQVGYHNDDINTIITRLFETPETATEEASATLTELAIKLKSRSRLGSEQEPKAQIEEELKPVAAPLNDKEEKAFERLKTLPFGTWFEFNINQQGDKVRRKLSWFNPTTGRCLFVNHRGVKTDDQTLEQLAKDLVRGSAQVVEAKSENLVDRALSAIVSTLKQFMGTPSTQEAPQS